MSLAPPQTDTVLSGPYRPLRIRVIAASVNSNSMRIQGVGIEDGDYHDRMLTVEQYRRDVVEESGELYSFDAQPTLFRLAVEVLRTKLAHAFDPEFAVSASQVDPLPHQLDAVYRHILPLPRIRFLLADDPGAGKTIMAGLLMRELMQRQGIEGRELTFAISEDTLVDQDTGTRWTFSGEAIEGELAGEQVTPVVPVKRLWFAWYAFHPQTSLWQPD